MQNRRLLTWWQGTLKQVPRLALAGYVGALAALAPPPARADVDELCETGDLDTDISDDAADGTTLYVHYDSGDCDGSGDSFDDADAEILLDAGILCWDGYDDLSFRDPYQNDLPDYHITVDSDMDSNAVAKANCVSFGTDTVSPSFTECASQEDFMRMVLMHEMYHNIQRASLCEITPDCEDDDTSIGSSFGKWVAEGTARYMQDEVFSDLDGVTYAVSFFSEVNQTLAIPTTSLFDLSYNACLFWAYCGEQLGTESSEPELGVDFQREFWENIEDGAADGDESGQEALENTLADFGTTLDDTWINYAIANFAKDLDLSLISDADPYAYVDENQNGEGAWNPVSRISFSSLPVTNEGLADTLPEYSIVYKEVDLTGEVTTCEGVGFRGEELDGEPMGWAVLGVDASNTVIGISKGIGSSFGRTFLVSGAEPIDRIIAILIGLNTSPTFEYWFDSGPLTLDIDTPTLTSPEHVNEDDTYRPFLIQLTVDGPEDLKPEGAGDQSVMGLTAEDFEVTVGGLDAEIVSAAYVGQYYWIVAAASETLAAGVYDLSVSLCGVLTDTNADAVVVSDTLFNHVIVVDQSGSMSEPTGNTKLDAAKVAASLYTDSVSEKDRIGLVSFNGNGIDCDDDAFTREAIALATDAQKADIKSDLTALVASGMTTIGDGLWRGQDQLDLFLADADAHYIVLLSDGMENEARYWDTAAGCDTAKSRIDGTDTVIHSIAFGPESDQDLMQDIASDTGGDYSYVDVEASSARGAGDLAMANELADAYMNTLQQTRELDRIFFTSGSFTGNTTVDIPIDDPALTDALFFFNVERSTANLTVTLRDPMGNPADPIFAKKLSTTSHGVYHFFAPPITGTWEATLTANGEVNFIAGVLAENPHSPHLFVDVAQIPVQGFGSSDELIPYQQGVPITILGFLYDDRGPVLGATVLADIELPNDSKGCGVCEMRDDGSQNDGMAGDGVYGCVFTQTADGSDGGVNNDDDNQPPGSQGVRGSYQVKVQATGTTTAGIPWTRYDNTSFQVHAGLDRDLDGMSDTWEIYYGTDPIVPDADEDPDQDQLPNIDEYYCGTDPLNPDTDGDGELDGSEVLRGRCPTDDDSVLKPLTDVEVISDLGDEPGELHDDVNLLRFPWLSEYAEVRIYRAKGSPTGFTVIATVEPTEDDPAPTNYEDQGVNPATTYFYRFQAVGHDGGETRLSPIVSRAIVMEDCDGNGVADPDELAVEVENEPFDQVDPNWSYLGSANLNPVLDVARLVESGSTFAAGDAFLNAAGFDTQAFEVSFDFVIADPAGGVPDGESEPDPDGLSLIVTGAAVTSTGGNGFGLGYSGFPADSFAVEFDTFMNFVGGQPEDPDGNHVGINLAGSVESVETAFVGTDFDETGLWHARVRFIYGEVSVFVTPPASPESFVLSRVIPAANVPEFKYFGFGAGTGANSADTDVDNVVITLLDEDCNGNGVVDACDLEDGTSPDANGNDVPDECEACPADANGDGVTDPLDSGFVQARLGCPVDSGDPECDLADLNGDGVVDPLDVGYVLARMGTCD